MAETPGRKYYTRILLLKSNIFRESAASWHRTTPRPPSSGCTCRRSRILRQYSSCSGVKLKCPAVNRSFVIQRSGLKIRHRPGPNNSLNLIPISRESTAPRNKAENEIRPLTPMLLRDYSPAACRVAIGTYPASIPAGGLTIKAGSISASVPIAGGARYSRSFFQCRCSFSTRR